MQYITGQTINATTIEFTTARGSTISIVLARNAKLGINGWLSSGEHSLEVAINGNTMPFHSAGEEAQLGYVIKVGMSGRDKIPAPAEIADQVKAIIAEYKDNNDNVRREQYRAEAQYQNHVDAVERIRSM